MAFFMVMGHLPSTTTLYRSELWLFFTTKTCGFFLWWNILPSTTTNTRSELWFFLPLYVIRDFSVRKVK